MNKNVIIYVLVGILILLLILAVFFPGIVYAIKDSAAGNAVQDKCAPAPGYTEQEWREHMSHHPNIYSECLD